MREWPFRYKAASMLIAAGIALAVLQGVLAVTQKHTGAGLESIGMGLVLVQGAIHPEMLFASIAFRDLKTQLIERATTRATQHIWVLRASVLGMMLLLLGLLINRLG